MPYCVVSLFQNCQYIYTALPIDFRAYLYKEHTVFAFKLQTQIQYAYPKNQERVAVKWKCVAGLPSNTNPCLRDNDTSSKLQGSLPEGVVLAGYQPIERR